MKMIGEKMIYRSDMVVDEVEVMGDDESIVRAMLVSTNKVPVEGDALQGRINFLMENRHGTPFEHTSLTVRASVPIFVAREWMRHRTLSYNEMSARYVKVPNTFYLMPHERPLVQQGKPGAYHFVEGSEIQEEKARDEFLAAYRAAWDSYQAMLDAGIAREVARSVLPVGTFTNFYVTGNVRAWLHFISLRVKDWRNAYETYPQYEIEQAARQVEEIIDRRFPATMTAFNNFGRVAP